MRSALLILGFMVISITTQAYPTKQYYSLTQETYLYARPDKNSEKVKTLDPSILVRYGYSRKHRAHNISKIIDSETGDSITTGWRYVKTMDKDSGYVMSTFMEPISNWGNVAAHDGLFIRKGPSTNEASIGKSSAGNLLQVLGHVPSQDPAYPEKWALVYHQRLGVGFVYSPYILPGRGGAGDECKNPIRFEQGTIRFYNYCVFNDPESKANDTLSLSEDILQMARNQLFSVTGNEEVDSIHVFFKPEGGFAEQYNPYLYPDFEKWYAQPRILIKPELPYQQLKGLNGFYRIPNFKYQLHENMSVAQLNLLGVSDTLSDMSGESENIAYIQIDGKPCNDYVGGCIFKLMLFIKKKRVVKYVTLGFEFGC